MSSLAAKPSRRTCGLRDQGRPASARAPRDGDPLLHDLGPRPPRSACSGFDELGDTAARELEDQLAVFGEGEDLAGDPEPDRLTEPGSRSYASDLEFGLLDAEPGFRGVAQCAGLIGRNCGTLDQTATPLQSMRPPLLNPVPAPDPSTSHHFQLHAASATRCRSEPSFSWGSMTLNSS
jgi:hypothetical protein